ncbi:hypothetical protein OIU85_022795 [Salix viminalis]|uniref:Uncharacterized protein n=1 Tax=Salix viminalis TaxID=40686 RepID=A0A9Q0U7M3_SALVM|nr:hypothetical protein OIU85_022795 [Salix viminalis]
MATSISMISSSPPPWMASSRARSNGGASASLSLTSGSGTKRSFSMNVATNSTTRSGSASLLLSFFVFSLFTFFLLRFISGIGFEF